jgi:hypothetical protein
MSVVGRRDSISMVILIIWQAIYGMPPFFPDDIMIAARVGVVFLAQVVESIIGWSKYPQTDLHESGGEYER